MSETLHQESLPGFFITSSSQLNNPNILLEAEKFKEKSHIDRSVEGWVEQDYFSNQTYRSLVNVLINPDISGDVISMIHYDSASGRQFFFTDGPASHTEIDFALKRGMFVYNPLTQVEARWQTGVYEGDYIFNISIVAIPDENGEYDQTSIQEVALKLGTYIERIRSIYGYIPQVKFTVDMWNIPLFRINSDNGFLTDQLERIFIEH